MNYFSVSLLTALLLCGAGPLFAFRPLQTEDSLLLGRDVKQIELGFEHSLHKEGADVYANALRGEMTYGLFESVNLLLSAPWQGWSSHGVSESGPGDVSMEVKYRAGRRAGWDLLLKPGFSLPAGNEAHSLGAGNGRAWLYGIAGRTAGAWQYFLNAGFLLNRNQVGQDENILKASAAAAFALEPELRLLGEAAAETNPDRTSSEPPVSALLGLSWSPYPTLDLDAGFKLGLTEPAADHGFTFGLTLRL